MNNFDDAFNKVVKAEGGYVNDPDDKGGETYLGISRKAHSTSKMWEIIDKIKKANSAANTNSKLTKLLKQNTELDNIAKSIYKSKYWDKLRCDEFNNKELAFQIFDMGVNAGVSTAIKLLCNINGVKATNTVTDDLLKLTNRDEKKSYYNKI